MTRVRLSQLYSLTHTTIDSKVTRKSPGVYVLDQSSAGPFVVAYAGRSDSDVKAALHTHVGLYRFFKYAYCPTGQAAFEAECELYHSHHASDMPTHPANVSGWKCPRCDF